LGTINTSNPHDPPAAPAGVFSAPVGPAVRWARRGAVAVADQALFAGTNFLVSVFLARHLDATGYGSFALAQAAFWLMGSAYGAVLTEPMIVFGAGRYGDRFSSYLASLIGAHWRIVLPVAAVTGLAGVLCGHVFGTVLGHALLGLAVALPLILLALLGRAANYARMRPGGAIVGSVLYCTIVLPLLVLLNARGWLTPGSAYLALGLGGAVAGVTTLTGLRPVWTPDRIPFRDLSSEHWAYGRWALATAAVSWIPLNVYYVVLPAWVGLAAGAGLKALMNLAQPALHTLLALTNLMLPVLVRRREAGGRDAVLGAAVRFLVIFASIAVCYAAVLWLLQGRAFDLLYGGKYREYAPALVWVGLIPVAASATVVLGSVLRAVERPDQVFRASASAAVVALTAGFALAAGGGVAGAAAAIVIAYLVTGVLMLRLIMGIRRD
jgi:O-antigen/teichoic acid export membrane protein